MQPETTAAPTEAPAETHPPAPPPEGASEPAAAPTEAPAAVPEGASPEPEEAPAAPPFRPALRVRAKGDGTLPHVNEKGAASRRPHATGRDRAGAALARGEWVHDLGYYRRAVRAGSLELLEEVR